MEKLRSDDDIRLPFVIRILGALGGLLGGGVIGTLALMLAVMVTGSKFGLTNIWPGTLIGMAIGAILGFLFPIIGKRLAEILNRL